MLFVVALTAAQLSQPILANTTYEYTGNPFTFASGPYTTRDFVTAMVTLARPLAANMPLTSVTPLSFSLSDRVQTLTTGGALFQFDRPHGLGNHVVC